MRIQGSETYSQLSIIHTLERHPSLLKVARFFSRLSERVMKTLKKLEDALFPSLALLYASSIDLLASTNANSSFFVQLFHDLQTFN